MNPNGLLLSEELTSSKRPIRYLILQYHSVPAKETSKAVLKGNEIT